jgi:diguanylate cyclase (GGDEF)-like protein
MPVAVYRAVNPARRRGSKLRRTRESSPTTPAVDLAARLRTFQRVLVRRVERRDAFEDIVRAVSATLDPPRVADIILEHAMKWLPLSAWAVVSGQLTVLADRGVTTAMRPAIDAAAAWVIQSGEEFATAAFGLDDRLQAPYAGAGIAFPLGCRGRHVGALVGLDGAPASRQPRLGPPLVAGVRRLLEPAAVALDNALLLKRAEALSVTDELTDLYNSRYLNIALRREVKRVSRTDRPLSLLFIDLDGFKGINDTHGHLFGSRALVEAAAVIRGSARETAIVARFGGDEFAVVLPDTGSAGAFAVGSRIRERIAAHHFLAAEGLDCRLTVSIGAATLPDVATSAEALLQAADAAMYQVKDAGKNGIRAAVARADT